MVSSTRSLKRMSHLKGEAVLSRHRYPPSADPLILFGWQNRNLKNTSYFTDVSSCDGLRSSSLALQPNSCSSLL